MMALGFTLNAAFHTGSGMRIPPRVVRAARALRRAETRVADPDTVRDYRLTAPDGRLLGTVRAATIRPTLGRHAPTVYLKR